MEFAINICENEIFENKGTQGQGRQEHMYRWNLRERERKWQRNRWIDR